MNEPSRLVTRALTRAVQLAAASLAIAGLGAVSGCLTRPIEPIEPLTTSVVVEQLTQSGVNKIDLVLVVDNSASMADKQQILALAIPDLVKGLVNPKCLDNVTNLPTATQPTDPTAGCPANSSREFPPVFDIHIGLLSSSLGTFGANGCPDPTPTTPCGPGATNNDHGHLVTRSDPCGQTAPVATYQNLGFLAWDPKSALTPPGETAIGDPTQTPPVPGLTTSLRDLVVGDGQFGCGFESQNEAWYRFLVDPTPYQGIQLVNNTVQTTGIDMTLLQQRTDFLRPDSLLAIINVTDETDTSIKEYSSYPLFAETTLHLPLPRQECALKGPLDPCCASCGEPTPTGCPPAPDLHRRSTANSYTQATENIQLRAFGLISHKARYGIEFFYQPSRYVAALTSPTVADANNKQVPNPIYSILDKSKPATAIRDSNLVFYAAIVGVPWQLIARQDKDGTPDLINGINTIAPNDVTLQGGFKSSAELDLKDAKGNTFWDDIAGDPENYVAAKSPYMVESTSPRSGTDPITGAVLSPVSTPNGGGAKVGPNGGSLINDHERTIPPVGGPPGDIEYACVFPILAPIDCSVPGATCDCPPNSGVTDNPLCEPNPGNGNSLTLQTKAKAYPGIKHLAIAKGMGSQGIAASICAKQVADPTADDFGYRPAVKAIIDRLKQALHGECLPRTLTPDPTGEVPCLILEATTVPAGSEAACNACTAAGRRPVSMSNPTHEPAVQAALQDPLAATAQWNCFCEIPQTTGPACTENCNPGLTDCQTAPVSTANGWCYVDPTTAPASFTPAQIAQEEALVGNGKCPATEQHDIRFVGNGSAAPGATLFITCAGQCAGASARGSALCSTLRTPPVEGGGGHRRRRLHRDRSPSGARWRPSRFGPRVARTLAGVLAEPPTQVSMCCRSSLPKRCETGSVA